MGNLGVAPSNAPLDGSYVPGDIKISARPVLETGWAWCSGADVLRTGGSPDYSALFAAICPDLGTVAINVANPGVATLNNHGMVDGDSFFFLGGTVPTGLALNTLYYANNTTTNTFRISASRNGASIQTTGSVASGVTLRLCPYGISNSTTFKLPDTLGRVPVGSSGTGGHAGVRNQGISDGIALATRAMKHYHTNSGLSVVSNSTGITYNTGMNGPNVLTPDGHGNPGASYLFVNDGPGHSYNYYLVLQDVHGISDPTHGHNLSGNVGDTTGSQDTTPYVGVKYVIRL